MMSEEARSVPSDIKKKRSLPGTPDPDAEVIALSPKSLMATNRFICEVCNKGFQRDQNLQLHRRGHNLPWKLRQRTNKELRKKVYVCPEKTCVHHDPSRALGDLTGIKKHYSRKHGEKKWKCDKCSKNYAVQSDWKAHSKICGTREYRCDCGTVFSRKDSFITHRAFCDALAEENARIASVPAAFTNFRSDLMIGANVNPQTPTIPQGFQPEPLGLKPRLPLWVDQPNPNGANSGSSFPDLVQTMDAFGSSTQTQWLTRSPEASFTSANLSMSALSHGLKQEPEENKGDLSHSESSLYSIHQNPQGGAAHISATALLQKAAQMGSTRSNPINVFGLMASTVTNLEWQQYFKQANQNESFNVNSQTSTNLGGGFLLNDSNSRSFVDHIGIMPLSEERENRTGIAHSGSNEDQLGLTRDFLGVGGDSISRPFLQQELAKINAIGSASGSGSAMYLSQYGEHP